MSVTRPEGVRRAMARALADRRRASISRLRILPGWTGLIVVAPSVIVDNFNVPGVAVLESEADAPWTVDRHRPLIFSRSRQLVESDRLQRTEVGERGRRV